MRILQLESGRTALEAAQLLTVFNSGSINVLANGSSVGTVTERDLVQRVLALRLNPEQVTLGQLVCA